MVHLRDVQAADKEMIRNWRNSKEVARYMNSDSYINSEQHEAWFQKIANDPTSRYWIIVYNERDVGLTSINHIDLNELTCHISIYIADSNIRGKGAGVIAIYLVLKYVFEQLCLNKVLFEHMDFNKPIIKIKNFFLDHTNIDLSRKQIIKDGSSVDVVYNAITRSDWDKIKAAGEMLTSKNKREEGFHGS